MKNKRLETASLCVQGIYSGLCVTDMVLCLTYVLNWDNELGRRCADIALGATVHLFFLLIPVVLLSTILNLCALRERKLAQVPRGGWLVWTILCPAVYAVFWAAAGCVFVASTGGV